MVGIFRRPKPLGITMSTQSNLTPYGLGPGVYSANQSYYSAIPLMWPGIWLVEVVGGGGGGGGYDNFYACNGEAGGTAYASRETRSVSYSPSAYLGYSGVQGQNTANGGTDGTAGTSSSFTTNARHTISSGGTRGRGGLRNTTYNYIPANGNWPYTGNSGRGGFGSTGGSPLDYAYVGAIRLTLKG